MELHAPPHWRCVDFISDLHLHANEPLTFQAWGEYLQRTTADALFILGDLFEIWVGDDVLADPSGASTGFEQQCAQVLRAAADRTNLYIMAGNRDFLMGPALMQACGCTLLEDPCVLEFGSQRWLLTHGDALCLDDKAYMPFRALVRSAQWQRDFLEKPLHERLTLALQMRAQSEARKQGNTVYADVDTVAAQSCLETLRADHMIHGHTHRPARHPLGVQHDRWVLSDWDLSAQPPRAEVLRLSLVPGEHGPAGKARVQRLSPANAIAAKPAD
ncbi:MAG: UDP-2,3-diacylglucosamine hydrolase [Burkholderiales bacterium RIFCSPLOWO2_12_FULL_61_40]|nr:MAG: UDP-2,3-diacylglucosamine hydrolase [Burkholderiales bacterium RIFCSPLOWO2_12_FULL_61_40]